MKPIDSQMSDRRQKAAGSLQSRFQSAWPAALLPFAGLASLIWFLVRVVPKPSRASYPCQRVAAPLASTFVLWLLAISGSALVFLRARRWPRKAHPIVAIGCVLVGAVSLVWAVSTVDQPAHADYPSHPANDPMGVAQGLWPGRVAWVYNPDVTDWAGPGTGERWYEHVDQAVADDMVSLALRTYTGAHADFPDVHYWDNRGTLGRTRAELGSEPLYWSTPDAEGTTQDYLPVAIEEAAYLINFAVLKSHEGGGITVAAKNHYGSLLRCPDGFLRGAPNSGSPPYNGYYHMHYTLPGDTYRVNPDMVTMGQYRALVDLMGHEGVGGKTLLYLVDGLFGGKNWYSEPSTWSMPPFDGDWPSSLFLSMDAVAIDSVARDFLSTQWPEEVLMYEGVEDYLHEAALAGNPPSGATYDPEDDGSPLTSLGVHEHWNNVDDKQYSRNLGTGDGIELVTPAMSVWTIYLPICVKES